MLLPDTCICTCILTRNPNQPETGSTLLPARRATIPPTHPHRATWSFLLIGPLYLYGHLERILKRVLHEQMKLLKRLGYHITFERALPPLMVSLGQLSILRDLNLNL